jgi:ABC-2 type transport system permease protein
MHQLRVIAALLRVSLMTAMQYRGNFWLDAVSGIVSNVARVAPLLLVFGHTEQVAGWPWADALLVMGFFLLLSALQSALLEPNLGEAVESIREGELDGLLLKPADAQLLVSFRKVDAGAVWDLAAAALVLGWALAERGAPAPFDALIAALQLLCGLLSMYALWLLAICLSFFFVRVDNLRYLLWSATDAGRWPVGVFGPVLRFLLTAVVPVALVTTLPAEALRGAWSAGGLAVALGVTVAFAVGSRVAWKRSLAAYTSASS